MAVSTAFVGAKLEALLISNTTSSSMMSASAGRATGFSASARARLAPRIRRGYGMIRCEAAPDALVDVEPTNAASFSASSLSALQQLKTSAADSMDTFLLLFFLFFPHFSYWKFMT